TFTSRRRQTRLSRDWSSDVYSSDLSGRLHDRTGGHEGDQILEETALAVLGVETGGFALGQLNHLGSDDAQAGLLETGGDFADDRSEERRVGSGSSAGAPPTHVACKQ